MSRTPPKKMNKVQYAEMVALTNETMWAFRFPYLPEALLPEEWKDIALNPVPAKTRITLRVDVDVAKFFRKLGKEYQATMNDVLRTFMLARLTEVFGEAADPFLMMEPDAGQKMDLEAEAIMRKHLDQMVKRRMGWVT